MLYWLNRFILRRLEFRFFLRRLEFQNFLAYLEQKFIVARQGKKCFLLCFLRRFGKFYPFCKKNICFSQKSFLTIFKEGKSIERPPQPWCVCILPWCLFATPICLQPSKKSGGGGGNI